MRGGLGRKMVICVPKGEYAPKPPVTVAVQAGRFLYPPQGLFEGNEGSRARFLKNNEPADPSGLTFCEPGDVLSFHSAGGGGYGNPMKRDIKAVQKDVSYAYVSIESAKTDYGVVIDPESLEVDMDQTRLLRASSSSKPDEI